MHPCRKCDVYESTGKNNGPDCEGCKAKDEFCNALGSMSYSVPDQLATYEIKPKKEIDMNAIEAAAGMKSESTNEDISKICRRDDCDKAGILQPLDHFYKNPNSKDGHETTCKVCRNRLTRERKKNRKLQASTPAKNRPAKKSHLEPASSSSKTITIDFSSHPEVYDALVNLAKVEIRTPENMALYLILTRTADQEQ